MLRIKTFYTALVCLVLSQSCVSLSEHEALQRRLSQTQQELERMRAERQKLRTHLDTQLTQIDSLNSELGSVRRAMGDDLEQAQKTNQQLASTLDEREKALASATRSKDEQAKLLDAYQERLKKFIQSGDLSVSLVDGKLIVALPADILFASGSARISDRGQSTLVELGRVFQSMPDKRLQVEGHTDNVPIRGGKFESNWHLGHARAMAVVDILLRTGVTAPKLSAASYGEFQPKAPNTDDENRQKNRRIEIVIIPKLDIIAAREPTALRKLRPSTTPAH
jgi:chemotaxis protein MotB